MSGPSPTNGNADGTGEGRSADAMRGMGARPRATPHAERSEVPDPPDGEWEAIAHSGFDAELLETELRALRPRDVPPALTARIARGIAADAAARKMRWAAAAAGVGLAACLAVALLAWRGSGWHWHGQEVKDHAPLPTVRGRVVVAAGRPVTLAAYRGALARSPEALDALLDAEARRPFAPAGGAAGSRAFQLAGTGGANGPDLPN